MFPRRREVGSRAYGCSHRKRAKSAWHPRCYFEKIRPAAFCGGRFYREGGRL